MLDGLKFPFSVKVWSKVLNGFAFLLCLLALFGAGFNDQLNLFITALLVGLPWLVFFLVKIYKDQFTFSDGEGWIAPAFIAPGFGLFCLTLYGFPDIEWLSALVVAVIIGFVMAKLFFKNIDPVRLRVFEPIEIMGFTICLALALVPYGLNLGLNINKYLDWHSTQTYQSQYADDTSTKGSPKGPPLSRIKLKPWIAGQDTPQPFITGSALERINPGPKAMELGQKVCIKMGEGALEMAWYEIIPCN